MLIVGDSIMEDAASGNSTVLSLRNTQGGLLAADSMSLDFSKTYSGTTYPLARILSSNEINSNFGFGYLSLQTFGGGTMSEWLHIDSSGVVKTNSGRIAPPTSIDNTDSPYTALASDHIILCNTTAGDITINLPAGVTGTIYTIKNTGTGTLTIDGNGAETIEEELTQTISTLNCPKIIFDGTEWWII